MENNFVVDASSGSVGVRQQQGIFNFTTNVKFPYLPIITNFRDHPVTKGLEQVLLPFASTISFSGDSSIIFTPLAVSSSKSGTQTPPLFFDIQKKWNDNDFPLSDLTVAALASGKLAGEIKFKSYCSW